MSSSVGLRRRATKRYGDRKMRDQRIKISTAGRSAYRPEIRISPFEPESYGEGPGLCPVWGPSPVHSNAGLRGLQAGTQ